MSLLIVIVCALFLLIGFALEKKIYGPMVLFNFWWGITIFISGFGFFGFYIPSPKTYLIMLLAIISFNFPIIVLSKKKFKDQAFQGNENELNFNQNNIKKFLLTIHIVIIVYLLSLSIEVLGLLLSGMNYSMVRYLYFYGDITNVYETLVMNWFITPLIYFSMILISILFFQQDKKNKLNNYLFITTILCISLQSFSSGGRGIVLSAALIFLLSFLMHRGKRNISFFKKMKIRAFFFVLIGGLIIITIFRTGLNTNIFDAIFQTVIGYYTAPYIYFEKLSEYTSMVQEEVRLYGAMFFSGIIDIFIIGLRFLGVAIKQPSFYLAEYNQTFLLVGNNISYNAFPNMVYTFIYDFGLAGVILGPMAFGFMAKLVYQKMISTNKIAYKGIYIMIGLMIYESVMKWLGTSILPWAVILLFFCYNYFSSRRIPFKN